MQDGGGEAVDAPAGNEERETCGNGPEVGGARGDAVDKDGGSNADGGDWGDDHDCKKNGEDYAHEDRLQSCRTVHEVTKPQRKDFDDGEGDNPSDAARNERHDGGKQQDGVVLEPIADEEEQTNCHGCG